MNPAFDIDEDELHILLAEADEQLQTLDEGLVRLERAGSDAQLLQTIFRAAHTLKGSAGIINHWRMADVTHALETVLDSLRKGALPITATLVDACLEALDALKLLRDEILADSPAPLDIAPIVARLAAFNPLAAPETPASVAPTPSDGPAAPGLFIRADIAADSLAPAARALQFVFALQALGDVYDLQPSQSAIESAAPVRQVTARLITSRSIDHVRRTLTSVPEMARLVIGEEEIRLISDDAGPSVSQGNSLRASPEADPLPADSANEEALRLGGFLLKAGYITQAQLQAALLQQAADPGRTELLGHALIRMGALTPEALDQAVAQQAQQLRSALQAAREPGRALSVAEKTVRTSVERLDNLMNLVGELITDRNRLSQIHNDLERQFTNGNHALAENLAQTVIHLSRITDQLQDEVMRIRLLPVANVFNKFPRLVRDLARKADKQVELIVRGEDTELDRSVIEEIGDPLIHLLRNAVAHGLETPDERRAAGKPERGAILLTARHEDSRIILTVEDDGRGIDLERVKASAVQKGLITAPEAEALTYSEVIDLIFRPGLSTAQAVDDVSGRGVGMDIVRTNIERLNGNILVETWPGRGARFQIILPLTLATIPTLLVRTANPRPDVDASTLAIPLAAVMETLRLPASAIHTVRGKPVTHVRGHVLPLVRLSAALAWPEPPRPRPATHEYVVAVRWGALEMGLLVDTLVGEQELVVKSLGALVGDTPGVSGAAILGDGRVALIVDVSGLFKLMGI